ncbi:hypothetical protein ACLOJK_020900 [Asimina triloba]
MDLQAKLTVELQETLVKMKGKGDRNEDAEIRNGDVKRGETEEEQRRRKWGWLLGSDGDVKQGRFEVDQRRRVMIGEGRGREDEAFDDAEEGDNVDQRGERERRRGCDGAVKDDKRRRG